jgi:hypothetical protein
LAFHHRNVGVKIAFIRTAVGCVDRDIDDETAAHQRSHEILDEPQALNRSQFVRQSNLHLPRERGVLSVLNLLDRVPELLSVFHPAGRASRCKYASEFDPLLSGSV